MNDDLISRQQAIEEVPDADHFAEVKEMVWHECIPDDPDSYPDDKRNVLMSFSNCHIPTVGYFVRDGYGDYRAYGTEPYPHRLGAVDGWWELPEKPKKEGDTNADE